MKHAKRRLSTILLALAVGFSLYLIYPILQSELDYRFGTFNPPSDTQDFRLTIPSLKLDEHITANVNPWDESEYTTVLKSGVAHATGSALPDQPGTTYLFAHSSADPLELLRTNPAFYRLHRARPGDGITLSFEGRPYRYRVTDLLTVKPHQVDYLITQDKDQLILQTCTPLGTDWNRLLVIAKPIDRT